VKYLAGNRWGVDFSSAITLYRGFVRPTLEFASVLWQLVPHGTMRMLDCVQRQALLGACGVPRTVPGDALEIYCNIQPLSVRRDELAIRWYDRVRRLPLDFPLTRLLQSGESGHPDDFAGTLLAVAKAKLRVLRLGLPRRVEVTSVVKTRPAPWIASVDVPDPPQVDGGFSIRGFRSEIRSTLHKRWVERFKTHCGLTYGEESRDHLSRLSPGTLWPKIAAVGSRPEQRVLAGLRFGHCPLQFWHYCYHGAVF